MRLRKADLRARVNAELVLRFQARGLTSFAGLELVRRYFTQLGLAARIRRWVKPRVSATDFGRVPMVLALLTLLIVGGRRLRHLMYLEDDPLVLRMCGLRRLPTPRTAGRWLERIDAEGLDGLSKLNEELVAETIRGAGLRRLTIDVDGTVVSTGLKVEGARRGFNPHHRKVPSYYPITAYEAQTGQMLRVANRAGNVHDGKGSLDFLGAVFEQVERSLGSGYLLEFRMDGAFFRRDVIDLLTANGAEYAIKVPFYEWVGLRSVIAARKTWRRVDASVESFQQWIYMGPWERWMRVAIFRKRVGHKTAKNYQLDLFDPADGHYEYSAVVTNKALSPAYVWHFVCGRGCHEKAYGELKNGFAFNCVPSMKCEANGAWQQLSVLAFNLTRGFQVATMAPKRRSNRKRRAIFTFASIHTLRHLFLGRAGVVVRPGGVAHLDVGTNVKVREYFERVADRLAEAA